MQKQPSSGLERNFTKYGEMAKKCSETTSSHGLRTTAEILQILDERRGDALRRTGRVEFGEGIFEKLIFAFCSSPYIFQTNYAETLAALQDCFYELKNLSRDRLSDDALIAYMEKNFDGRAGGSVDYLLDLGVMELGGAF